MMDFFRIAARKTLEVFPEILQLPPEIIGLLQELQGEASRSLGC